ncbi:MAG: bifunctional protein-serine/threonine kinase/phosphatase [Gammaproteobacteria bacterium]|nr:bifunctional protein-serine/threonine kinase/phosphatase [Gammaproteobacteria bacterium]
MTASLKISAGNFTDKGKKGSNQDCQGFRVAEGSLLQTKGAVAAIADGVSSSEYGGEAAVACVRGLISDYFSTPESWSIKKSDQKIFTSLNGWPYRRGDTGVMIHRSRVSTLSAVIFKSTTAHVFHVGDSRICMLRQGNLEQLTVDHRNWVSVEKNYLSRAMGIDIQLQIDYSRFAMEPGDIFLLTTDGVHDYISEKELISTVLSSPNDLNKAAALVVRKAMEHDSPDNLSCQILRIEQLPSQDADEVYKQLTELPFPPELSEGMILDGYRVIRELHASSRSQLYLALDTDTGLNVALKTPSANFVDDPSYIERFTMEEWVGRRIENSHVLKLYEPTRRRRFLYHIAEYLPGQTLRQWMHDNPAPELEEVRAIVEQISNGLQAFHRQDMLHQDLKPENIMVDKSGTWKIVDFGSTKVAGIEEIDTPVYRSDLLGTKNYTAPEYLTGKAITSGSDIFSLGVITYEMLTGHLPYGEMPSNWKRKHWDQLQYIPARNYLESIPQWFDGMLKKAVTPEPLTRYQELSEFIYDLRNPNNALVCKDQRPLLERNPTVFWQGLSAVLLVINLLLIFFLVR